MLRVSNQVEGNQGDLNVITQGQAATHSSGVEAETELVAFAESALGDDAELIKQARQAVADKLGDAAMVDAAAVIANFQRMVRIADGCGIPLDEPVAMATGEIRQQLGINDYGSAENTPALSAMKRLMGRLLTPLMPMMFKRMAKRAQKQNLH